jgi:hypothetical protein
MYAYMHDTDFDILLGCLQYSFVHIHAHTYIHIYIHTYIHTYIQDSFVHIHAHTYMHIHTYIHTYIHTGFIRTHSGKLHSSDRRRGESVNLYAYMCVYVPSQTLKLTYTHTKITFACM